MSAFNIRLLNQPAPSEIAEVAAAGAFDEVDGEFQQANFPRVVDALNHGAEWFFGMLDLAASPFDDRFHGIADAILYDVGFAKLEAVTEHGHVARALAKHLHISRGLLAEAFQEQPAIMFRRQDLRTLGVDPAVADADFVYLIHEFRDQVETKTGAAESGDLFFRREDHAGVFDRVLEVVVGHWRVTNVVLMRGLRQRFRDRLLLFPA